MSRTVEVTELVLRDGHLRWFDNVNDAYLAYQC